MARDWRASRARSLLGCILGALALFTFASAAEATRPPSTAEAKALVTFLRQKNGARARVQRILISTIDGRYATARYSVGPAVWIDLLRHRSSGWAVIWLSGKGEPTDGACAYASAPVVLDLYGVRCPPRSETRARLATQTEAIRLRAVFARAASTRLWSRHNGENLRKICVSRVNQAWAAAAIVFPNTEGFVWFRSGPNWTPAFETISFKGTLPPRRVILSLAYCVGYNAAQYGA